MFALREMLPSTKRAVGYPPYFVLFYAVFPALKGVQG